MNAYYVAVAVLIFLTGAVHSVLGEKFILIRLMRRDLPKLGGSDWFTKRTLRFAWHLTTVAWWGIGFIVFEMSHHGGEDLPGIVAWTLIAICLVSGALAFGFTRGRHLSWVAFLAGAVLVWLAM